mmetsp:Transcript_9847/g.21334  ORF Transcript_9847/g.21334 Transcript_9847/m.21334 type:complete len:96 (-) Transcript_9847:227-514(-)
MLRAPPKNEKTSARFQSSSDDIYVGGGKARPEVNAEACDLPCRSPAGQEPMVSSRRAKRGLNVGMGVRRFGFASPTTGRGSRRSRHVTMWPSWGS